MKDTAVDYLYNIFSMLLIEYGEDKIDFGHFCELMELGKNAAKNIEKIQIDKAYNDGLNETSPMTIDHYKLNYEQ